MNEIKLNDIKVAKILDDYRVVINVGRLDGIREGSGVIIFEIGEEILDPITGENLGKLEIIKGTGTVTHVQEKIATVESNMKKDVGKQIKRLNPYSRTFISAYSPLQQNEIIEEMPKEAKPFEEPSIGDCVRITRL